MQQSAVHQPFIVMLKIVCVEQYTVGQIYFIELLFMLENMQKEMQLVLIYLVPSANWP